MFVSTKVVFIFILNKKYYFCILKFLIKRQ